MYQPTSIGFMRNETFSQLRSENAGHLNSPEAYYESVLEGREDVNTSVDPEPSSAVSTTTSHGAEHLDLVYKTVMKLMVIVLPGFFSPINWWIAYNC